MVLDECSLFLCRSQDSPWDEKVQTKEQIEREEQQISALVMKLGMDHWTMVVMLGYLKTRLVMVVVEKLVNDEESRPVSAGKKMSC